MKKILFLLAVLCQQVCQAQTNNLELYTQVQDSLLQNLDTGKLLHHNLYDRVFPWANLDGTDFKVDTTNNNWCVQAFSEIRRCQYYTNPLDSFTVDVYNAMVKYANTSHILPLLVTNAWLDYIDTNAFNDGRLVYDTTTGMYYKGTDTINSPFSSKQITFANLGVPKYLNVNQVYQLSYLLPLSLNNNAVAVDKVVMTSTLMNTRWDLTTGSELEFTSTEAGVDYLKFELVDRAGKIIGENTQRVEYRMAADGLAGITCTMAAQTVVGFEAFQGPD
jgi:hypothetical protein